MDDYYPLHTINEAETVELVPKVSPVHDSEDVHVIDDYTEHVSHILHFRNIEQGGHKELAGMEDVFYCNDIVTADNIFQADEDRVKDNGQANFVEAVDILDCVGSENAVNAVDFDNLDANVVDDVEFNDMVDTASFDDMVNDACTNYMVDALSHENTVDDAGHDAMEDLVVHKDMVDAAIHDSSKLDEFTQVEL